MHKHITNKNFGQTGYRFIVSVSHPILGLGSGPFARPRSTCVILSMNNDYTLSENLDLTLGREKLRRARPRRNWADFAAASSAGDIVQLVGISAFLQDADPDVTSPCFCRPSPTSATLLMSGFSGRDDEELGGSRADPESI